MTTPGARRVRRGAATAFREAWDARGAWRSASGGRGRTRPLVTLSVGQRSGSDRRRDRRRRGSGRRWTSRPTTSIRAWTISPPSAPGGAGRGLHDRASLASRYGLPRSGSHDGWQSVAGQRGSGGPAPFGGGSRRVGGCLSRPAGGASPAERPRRCRQVGCRRDGGPTRGPASISASPVPRHRAGHEQRIQRLEEHRLDVPPPPRLHLTDSGTRRVYRPPSTPCAWIRTPCAWISLSAWSRPSPKAPPTDPSPQGAQAPSGTDHARLEGGDRSLVVGRCRQDHPARVLAGEVRPTAGTARAGTRAHRPARTGG